MVDGRRNRDRSHGEKPYSASKGRKFALANERHAAFVSELASAAGEVELANGNVKTASKLLRLSSKAPTDNAIAQAQYLAQFDNNVRVAPHLLCEPAVCEGRYWKALSGEKWNAHIVRRWHGMPTSHTHGGPP